MLTWSVSIAGATSRRHTRITSLISGSL